MFSINVTDKTEATQPTHKFKNYINNAKYILRIVVQKIIKYILCMQEISKPKQLKCIAG